MRRRQPLQIFDRITIAPPILPEPVGGMGRQGEAQGHQEGDDQNPEAGSTRDAQFTNSLILSDRRNGLNGFTK